MNPSLEFLLIFIISLELSIKNNLYINLVVIAFALVYLVVRRIAPKKLFALIAIPFIPAFTIFATLFWFNGKSDPYNAWSLATRVYVYTLTIACLAHDTTSSQFARSLEQNFHLPSKFTYGVLAALNIIPQMASAVKQIRVAGMMRGMYLSFWSPMLYFKAILVALNSADNLAQGMESHGYTEGQERSVIEVVPLTLRDWLIFALLLALFNLGIFIL